MPKAVLMLFANPDSGLEQEFNKWYDEVHFPEMLELPGILSGRRFCVSDDSPAGYEPPAKYLALYEVDTDDLQGMMAELTERAPAMTWSSSIILDGTSAPTALIYERV